MRGETAWPSIRVVILTESSLLREGLSRAVASDRTIELVHDVHSSDVALLDSAMPHALQRCAEIGGAAVLFVAAPEDDAWALHALGTGARGIVPQAASVSQLAKAIRTVHGGMIWARRTVLCSWIDHLARRDPLERSPLEHQLSARERDVLRCIVVGLANKEIADRLSITEATVKVHLTHIFRKIGVHGRAQLAAAYHGIVDLAH